MTISFLNSACQSLVHLPSCKQIPRILLIVDVAKRAILYYRALVRRVVLSQLGCEVSRAAIVDWVSTLRVEQG